MSTIQLTDLTALVISLNTRVLGLEEQLSQHAARIEDLEAENKLLRPQQESDVAMDDVNIPMPTYKFPCTRPVCDGTCTYLHPHQAAKFSAEQLAHLPANSKEGWERKKAAKREAEMARMQAAQDVPMDDGILMPMYKARCTGCHGPKCPYVHQEQADKFPAEAIEALPLDRRTARAARGRGSSKRED